MPLAYQETCRFVACLLYSRAMTMPLLISWRALSRRVRYILVVVVLVLVVGVATLFGPGGSPVSTLAIARGDFATQVSVSGSVTAAQDVDLGFAGSGRILGVYARVGDRVSAGAVLAQIENGDLVANVAEAQAKLASLEAGTRPEEIAVAEVALANAQAALAASMKSAYTTADDAVHNRADALFNNPRTSTPTLAFSLPNAILKSTLEQERSVLESTLVSWQASAARVTAPSAEESAPATQVYFTKVSAFLADTNAALNQAVPDQVMSAAAIATDAASLAVGRTNLNTAQTTFVANWNALISAEKDLMLKRAGSTPEDIAAQKAILASAHAALAKTRVVAPFGGVITRMDAKAGEIVSSSISGISMQSDGIYQIEVYIPEVSIADITPGQSATTTLDAYGSSVTFAATVVAVDPAETLKNGVPTYKTTLAFSTADPRIRSGMTADVRITTGMLHGAIVIPAGAVKYDEAGAYVTVLSGKSLERRSVEVGSTPALGQVEIVEGLSEGESISLVL